MEIILLSKTRGSLARRNLGLPSLAALCLAIVAALFYGTHKVYQFSAKHHSDRALEKALAEKKRWDHKLALHRKALDQAMQRAESNFSAIAARLGELQAHMSRLNAFGSRLTVMAGIPEEEFDFDAPPALGGPSEPATQQPLGLIEAMQSLERLSKELKDKEAKLIALETLLLHRQLQAQIAPGGNPTPRGWISSGFGMRTNPINGKREFHRGIDFAGSSGAEVLTVAAGVVTWSDTRNGYGNLVEIDHGNGFLTRYAHNKKNLVKVGDKVKKGQVIALMGSTGRSTGPHVHFEVVRDGKIVNPSAYIHVVER